MQNSPSLAGALVRVRRASWQVVELRLYDQCQLLTLSGAGPANAGMIKRVLAPFDSIDRVETKFKPTFVRPRTWRRACRALLVDHGQPGALQTAHHARMAVLPH